MKSRAVRALSVALFTASVLAAIAPPARAADPAVDPSAKARATLDKAVPYLKSQQKDTGGWGTEKDPPALTALVLKAIVLGQPQDKQAPYVQKGYQNLLSNQLANGEGYFGDPGRFKIDYEKRRAVTPDDVKRVATRYLTKGRVVLSIVPMGKPELASKPSESQKVGGGVQ